jgi:DNA-binding protein H-NS
MLYQTKLRLFRSRQNRRNSEVSETDPTATDSTQPEPTAANIPNFNRMSEAETMAFVEAFLSRLSPAGLATVIQRAQEKQQERQKEAKEALLAEFRQKAASLGLQVNLELLETPAPTRQRRSDAGQILPVRYRGPNGETWSGRGHPPNWLTGLEAVGRNREEFRVREESE